MSLLVNAYEGLVEASFQHLAKVRGEEVFSPTPVSVRIGEYGIPLDHFCEMAGHFLGGGFFGFGPETPESVNKTLSYLFELYEQKDGKWVRKEKYTAKLG